MLKLRRITTGASWIPQIDGLRFVAIVGVILFHCGGEVRMRGLGTIVPGPLVSWLDESVRWGDRGVILFFVISGYILARPFLREHRLGGHKVKLGAYFLRRLTRLEPPYVVSLLIYAFAEHFDWHTPLHVLLPHLLASIFYVHNLAYRQMSLVSFVTWSLEIEVQFYILAPLLGMLYRIENAALRRATIAALIAIMGVISLYVGPVAHLTLLGYAQYFLAGFLLADLLEIPRHATRQMWRWDLVSLLGWPLIFYLPPAQTTYAWFPFLIIPVYLAAFYGKASNWFFRQPFIALTGGMCYSIYLMHMLIISTVFRAVKHLRFDNGGLTMAIQMAILACSVLLVSTLYFVLIERPCMDPAWPQKLWRRLHLQSSNSNI